MVDGWLGFMLGSSLWYPLWSPEQVQGTAVELAKMIGDDAKYDGKFAPGPASPGGNPTHMMTSASAPTISTPALAAPAGPAGTAAATAANGVTANGGEPDYAGAWALLNDPFFVRDADGIQNLLAEQAASACEDLGDIEEEVVEQLCAFLKPVGTKKFLRMMKRTVK
jgi:hypothetical protein